MKGGPAIGLKMPTFAKIDTYVSGQRPTYTEGKVIAKAISAEISINSSSASLYADDVEVEHDESFNSGTITFGINGIDYETEALMFGSSIMGGLGSGEILDAADDQSAEGGFGYYRVIKSNGQKEYEAVWLLRTKFKKMNESTQTKGESLAFQTPSIEGTIMQVENYKGGLWRERKMFLNENECISYIKDKAGIEDE